MHPDVNRSERRGTWSWKLTIAWALSIAALSAAPAAHSQSYTFTTLAGTTGGPGSEDNTGAAARFSSPWDLAVDAGGNIYVADSGTNTIRKMTPAGVVTTLAGLADNYGFAEGRGGYARFYLVYGLTVDSAGNVFVADWINWRIRKITPSGQVTTVATVNPYPEGVAIDGSGNLYVAGGTSNTIQKVTPGGVVMTIAGQNGVSGSTDGVGTNALFDNPGGIAVDSSGNLFVSDSYNHTIRKITAAGVVTTIAGSPGNTGAVDGNGSAARFYYPHDLTVDGAGNVFVADSFNNTIRKIAPSGDVTSYAGLSGDFGGNADGTGSSARFQSPRGITRDGSGNLYVADTGNSTIRKIAAGAVVTTIAGTPALAGAVDATGTAARFNGPEGMVVSGTNIYLVENENNTIRQVTTAGTATTFAGLAGSRGSTDAAGTSARFDFPRDIARDSAGNLYVADVFNNTIRKVTPGGNVTTFAGLAGQTGSTDGTGTAARFFYPQGVAVDNANNVYVTDYGNSTIRKITPAGVVTTFAGLAGTMGTTDGTGSNARFETPWHIAIDTSGNLFVTDGQNQAVRKITPAGVVTTFAGSPTEIGSSDGVGSAARFYYPGALAVDSAGTVYVADSNCTIRTISPAALVTTIGGQALQCFNTDGSATFARFTYPAGLTFDNAGNLYVTSFNRILKGTPSLLNIATIDSTAGAVGVTRQLGGTSNSATSWQWSIIRRPTGSSAQLSSSTIRNPQFTPDVPDIYVFRLTASNGSSSSITTVQLSAGSAPVITAASPIARTAGSPSDNAVTIATVSDAEDPAYSLSVIATSVPAGITVSGLSNAGTDASSTITATVTASCAAAPGANNVTLQVQDSLGLTSTATLTINVAANPPPTLGTYSNTTLNQGQSTTVFASAPPFDNGTVALSVSPSAGYTGNLSVNQVTGEVTVWNTNQGSFTITLLATDNCGATTTRTFTLTVNAVSCPITPITCPGNVSATLTTSSCPNGSRGPNYYADIYTFSGTAGALVTIDQTSAELDSYLYLLRPDGTVAASNDDGGGGVNSQIIYTLTTSGTWIIHSTTYYAGATGSYQLSLTGCGCTVTPLKLPTAADGSITSNDCPNSPRGPAYYAATYSFPGGGFVTVDVSSSAFDTYLYLVDPFGNVTASDNDSGGGTNSRIALSTFSSNAGPWKIYVTTNSPGAVGNYHLLVRTCGAALTPSNLSVTYSGTGSSCNTGATCETAESIRFTSRATSGLLCETATYAWDFGDGASTATGYQASHAYTSPGTYTVSVVVSDGIQSATASTTVTVGAVGSAGHAFTHFAGNTGGYGSEDGILGDARFDNPFGVYVDSAGSIYVAELGTTIRKITSGGVVSTVAGQADVVGIEDGRGAAVRFAGPRHMVGDAAGNVFVADAENHTIRKVSAGGVVTTFAGLAGFPGSADGTGNAARFDQPRGIAIDTAGNLYVGDTFNHTIRKITPAGVVSTIAGSPQNPGWVDSVGSSARFSAPYGVCVDASGNVYVAELTNHTIRKITPGGLVTTLAGQAGVSGSANGTGSGATFNLPKAVAVDGSGNVYVVDQGNNAVRKVTPGGVVTTLAGAPGVAGSEDGVGSAARFNFPQGLAIDGSGNLFVADSGNNEVRKVTSGGEVSTVAGSPIVPGATNATAGAARFKFQESSFPDHIGVAIDSSGNVVVADVLNHTIRRITPGGVVTTLAGLAGTSGTSNGTGSDARFNNPRGVAIDGAGYIYVADTSNHTIRMVTPAGAVVTVAGQANVSGSANGTGTAAQFSSPRGLAFDAAGNLLIADAGNHALRKMTPTGVVTTVATGALISPRGVAVDIASGNAYVTGSVTIWKVTPDGTVSTFAGGSNGAADGIGAAARFVDPYGVATDAAGNVYIADSLNYAIRKITPAGLVSTIGGSFGRRGAADGGGTAARFFNPSGIAVASNGNLYVVDASNQCIRIGRPILPDTATATPATGAVGLTQQFDAVPQNATSWQWKMIRRPAGSSATLTSETIRNPQFTPDVKDLYVFRLTATTGTQTSITTLSLNVANTLPAIAAGASVTRTAGSPPGSAVVIATVSDTEDNAQSLQVTPLSLPAGLTIDPIANNAGSISATVTASCNATAGAHLVTLRVQDGAGATSTATLTVNVTANPAPSLGAYFDVSMPSGTTNTVTPSPPASDNGTVTISRTITPAGFTGTITPHPSQDGRLTITNATGGVWTVTVTATDDCGKTTSTQFQLRVSTNFQTAPQGFSATAVSTTQVLVQWAPVAGTDIIYKIERSARPRSSYNVLSTQSTTFLDEGLTPNTAYVYRVYATSASLVGARSPNSAPDIATTIAFTDPLNAGMTATAAHVLQIRTAVNLIRQAADLGPTSFTDEGLPAGTAIKAVHVNELRTAIVAARAAFASVPGPDNPGTFAPLAFTDTIAAGTFIKAIHLRELRDAVR